VEKLGVGEQLTETPDQRRRAVALWSKVQRAEFREGVPRLEVIAGILPGEGLEHGDGRRAVRELTGNLSSMPLPGLVAIGNDEHLSAAEEFRILRAPLPRTPRIARGNRAHSSNALNVLFSLNHI
jgi:hypothetical protein